MGLLFGTCSYVREIWAGMLPSSLCRQKTLDCACVSDDLGVFLSRLDDSANT